MSFAPDSRIPVALLGATGSVGQRFVQRLAGHPWFRLAAVTGSQRSIGRPYGEAVSWFQSTPLPAEAAQLEVQETAPGLGCSLVFSALGGRIAGDLESRMADAGHLLVTNASSHRMDPHVPLVVPEVNPDHLALARTQSRGSHGGAILANPNCSTIGLALVLKPLHDAFGIREVMVTTLQAASGAGLPGVPSLHLIDNVVPYIGGEEAKLETEPCKILGTLQGDRIEPAPIAVSAQCTRVSVVDGHTECLSVRLVEPASAEQVSEALAEFRAEPQRLELPSAPTRPVHVTDDPSRPQPRLDRDLEGGMGVTVGRIRPCPLLDWKMVALSHNTVRGAAGGALLLAELAVASGLFDQLPGTPETHAEGAP